MATLIPGLSVHDGAAALEFYKKAFGAEETYRMTDSSTGKIGHAEITIGDARISLADEWPEGGVYSPKTIGRTPVYLSLEVDDVDAAFERAVAAGATVERPLKDEPYGRIGWLFDPFGHRWSIMTPAPPVSREEFQEQIGDSYVVS